MTILPISPATWNDFVALMQSEPQCRECFCLNHREPAGCATGEGAKARMSQLLTQGKVGGLLAFEGEKCIGWIAIDPMTELVGHDCQPSARDGEWAIHCIFVLDGFRGKGASTELIRAAIELAKSRGAHLVSAFPIPAENRERFPVNEAEFSGRYSSFSKMGFRSIGQPADFYQRMELEV
ncbi:MAG: GNAT family N-acetyltransferase [Bdellovibrionales bacterium]